MNGIMKMIIRKLITELQLEEDMWPVLAHGAADAYNRTVNVVTKVSPHKARHGTPPSMTKVCVGDTVSVIDPSSSPKQLSLRGEIGIYGGPKSPHESVVVVRRNNRWCVLRVEFNLYVYHIFTHY
eukprot:GHVR01172077.1.p2 GENE.GHVR01172077.1~~GHVR01172077.1.p2  ORF type:complete len:125 (-),score=17.17 GHVR01172077.1:230-604(-)